MRSSRVVIAGSLAFVLAGCGLWSGPQEQSRVPRDATVYKCDGNKQLVVRYLDGGKSAMVILPEREFRLDQVPAASGARYSNGRTTLSTQDKEAYVDDGNNRLFTNCISAAR